MGGGIINKPHNGWCDDIVRSSNCPYSVDQGKIYGVVGSEIILENIGQEFIRMDSQ